MKKKKLIINVFLCVALFLIMIFTIAPILNNIKFGLDLQGGFEVLYKVSPLDGELTEDMLTATYKTISRRIDVLGVSEPNISVEGNDRIRVGLAGVTDKETARSILGKQANLTFRDVNDNLLMNSDVLKSGGARVTTDQNGRPAVSLGVKNHDKFYDVTSEISKEKDNVIVIWLDYEEGNSYSNEMYKCGSDESNCLSAATVSQGFSSDVIIQGNFTEKEVKNLVDLINSGSLPTKLEEISSKTVGAEFGEDSLNKTLIAGVIGISLIIVLLFILYRFAGMICSLGIMIYTYLTFLLFYLIGGVLTLPGIAALVIGIGMAVDTCVINFARIKDELSKGSSLKNSVKKGNKSSLLTIIDANITTLLVAVILFILGESSIKGFATMLIISIFVTLIVMLGITRWIMNMFVETHVFDNKLNLFVGYKNDKKTKEFDYIKFGKKYMYCVYAFIVIGIISLCVFKFNLGLDFKGGTSISIKANNEITLENIENDLNELNYELIDNEKLADKNYIVKISNILDHEEVAKVEKYFTEKYDANTEIGVISNLVKRDLIMNAFKSLLFAIIGIVIYVSIRFKFSYAISGIAALFLDVFSMIAIFSLFKIEVTTIFVAAVLSIIGYSINDTIVIFDRVREHLKEKEDKKLTDRIVENAVNTSLKETVSRSVITTITTMIPVITLILFGSKEIINFNIAMLIGLISGTLSSLFLAPLVWLKITKKEIKNPNKKKWYEDDGPEEKAVKGINA